MHVAKAGAVLKIDLATCQVIEIVGTISDRETKRAEGLVAKQRTAVRAHSCSKRNGLRSMAKEPTAADRDRFKAARAHGEARAHDASALVDAHYDRTSDAVVLIFRGGGSMRIPRHAITGLERQPASALESLTLSPAGDALLWPAIDADV